MLRQRPPVGAHGVRPAGVAARPGMSSVTSGWAPARGARRAPLQVSSATIAVMSSIRPAAPRDTVHARLPDGRIFEAPPSTPIGDILRVAEAQAGLEGHEAVAAVIDGRLRELTMPLVSDADVAAVTLSDADGSRIYRRSLTLVLVTAAAELFPDAAVFIEHSAPTLGAYYCRVRGHAAFSATDLEAIAARMRAIVAADVPIHKTKVPLAQAVAIFEARGETDKARLLAHRQQDSLVLVRAVRTAGLLPGLHAALHRTPAPVRAASAGRRLRAAVPAHGQARRTGALRAYPKLFRGLRPGRRLARHAGHPRHRRAQRRDHAGPAARSVAGRRSAARGAHQPHR